MPTKRRLTSHAIETRARGHRRILDSLVLEMHRMYQQPLPLREVARRYHRTAGCLRGLFRCRGLPLRPAPFVRRQANGSPVPYKRLTPRQIDQLIVNATRLCVPRALKREWRDWTLAQRADFIARLRVRLRLPGERPNTPFSANVRPFDYGTPEAHEICKRMNAGHTSRTARIRLSINSHGVIFEGRLWFWCAKVGYQAGPWTSGKGRPSLHKTIWERQHGRSVPPSHVLRFIDGNRNNLVPENLRLATRNDLARENQAAALLKAARERTELLLKRSQKKGRPHGISYETLAASE